VMTSEAIGSPAVSDMSTSSTLMRLPGGSSILAIGDRSPYRDRAGGYQPNRPLSVAEDQLISLQFEPVNSAQVCDESILQCHQFRWPRHQGRDQLAHLDDTLAHGERPGEVVDSHPAGDGVCLEPDGPRGCGVDWFAADRLHQPVPCQALGGNRSHRAHYAVPGAGRGLLCPWSAVLRSHALGSQHARNKTVSDS
jgi:hypothetical protein